MKKVLNIVLCVLLVVSLIFNGFQYSKNRQLKEKYLAEFQQEISFTIQRLEGYQQSGDEAEYTTAISHIYAAYTAVSNYAWLTNHDDLAISYSGYFHSMWNQAIFYPEQFKEITEEVLEALKSAKLDDELNDLETIYLFEKRFAF